MNGQISLLKNDDLLQSKNVNSHNVIAGYLNENTRILLLTVHKARNVNVKTPF